MGTDDNLGGGIEVTGGTNTFSGQTISGNSADIGGGISYGGLGDSITNATISGNTAAGGAGGVYVNTPGLSITHRRSAGTPPPDRVEEAASSMTTATT